MLDFFRCLWKGFLVSAIAGTFILAKGGGGVSSDREHAQLAIQVTAHGQIPEAPGKALDKMPALVLMQPPPGKRLPYDVGMDTSLTIQVEIISNPLLLNAIDAKVCVEFDEVHTHMEAKDDPTLTFKALQDDSGHCFPGRSLELRATGFLPGDYRLRTILRIPSFSMDETNFTSSAIFKVVSKVPFEPSYDWARVEEWQHVQAGLDVKMPIGGDDFKRARIPQEWKLQVFVLDEMGNKKGAGKIHRVMIKRTDSLGAVRAVIAEAAHSAAPCISLSLGGSKTDWSTLESSEDPTVEGAKLFERGVEISGELDRESGTCACYVPEKGRACHVALSKLESCEMVAGQSIGACAEEESVVADCFTRCSVIGDPYRSALVSLVKGEYEPSALSEKSAATAKLNESQEYKGLSNQTALPPAIGAPLLPLQKGWSDLQWGGDEAESPAGSQWARCKLCTYTLGTWGGLGVHVPESGSLSSDLPKKLASSPHASLFRTWRSSFPAPAKALQEEYDEASSTCGSGAHVVSSPAFIVSVYDVLNIHRLIADLILPIFRTVVTTYGNFRNDTIIFLEVGHEEQAPRLQQLLQGAVKADIPLKILSHITRRPVGSAASLELDVPGSGAVEKTLCFRDLHIGLSLDKTSSALGFRTKFVDPLSPDGLEAIRWQHMLREHVAPLASTVRERDLSPPLPVGILFVKRLQTRKFKNLVELKAIARDIAKDATARTLATTTTTTTASEIERVSQELGGVTGVANGTVNSTMVFPPDWKGWTNEVVMERLTFSQQVEQLRKATVLVAMLGQGAANAAFMRPGSSLLLVVPPKLDGEKYAFANIAVASGVHVFVIEGKDKSLKGDTSPDKGGKAMQESWNEKDITVDPVSFKPTLHFAVAYASKCDFQTCENLMEASVHSWSEVEEFWKLAEQQLAAEKAQAKAAKQAKEAEQKARETQKVKTALEDQIRKARAQVLELEGKLAAMTPPTNTSTEDALHPMLQHGEL